MYTRLVLLLFAFVAFNLYADDAKERINLEYQQKHWDHHDLPIPADEPDVYYDNDAQQIIIDGTGYVSYYDVEITSQSTWDVVVSTSVNGSYDTIDISSLPDDDYIITIDSPLGNTYEGYFQTY